MSDSKENLNSSKLQVQAMTETLVAHTIDAESVLAALRSSKQGLSQSESDRRLLHYGRNKLPEAKKPGLGRIFIHQFKSPLIYVLVVAALMSVVIQEWSDAGFILAVLVINGVIGTIQEFSAQNAASALSSLVTTSCRVLREGDSYEVDAVNLVPGDVVQLESGDRIPADMRLLSCFDLEVDESLLTGESIAVLKDSQSVLEQKTVLGDRQNMLFAGSIVMRGRGLAVVVATAMQTELGKIAAHVLGRPDTKAPLLIRMERFTHGIAIIVAVAAIIMAIVAFSRGMPLAEIFLIAVALAVSAIPEGLPVALTVALAIGMRRMAKRHVIVRELVAVEALGSCTFIATDKTGTLTVNQLTSRCIEFPGMQRWTISGLGVEPVGDILNASGNQPDNTENVLLRSLCEAAVLTNDGFLGHRGEGWSHHGDAVDVSLLVMAYKAGIKRVEMLNTHPELAVIPFESERMFSASLHQQSDKQVVYAKGALEKLLPMCDKMLGQDGQQQAINVDLIEQQARSLASEGYRVIALAGGQITITESEVFSEEHLSGLSLIGLVGMIDPLRSEAKNAIASCRQAGIEVAMITGDHPITAFAIARQLDLAQHQDQIITGPELKQAEQENQLDQLTEKSRVFARVEPQQKLDIVQALQRNGHFVAVSGDGANDAPALKAGHVGVAMGESGTDVARETADLIITDDDFSSIVAGVEEGRIAYANVRKVIFLLISTGMAEIVLFTLSLLSGMPLPLLAVQLLWLNLVTNGIQDVALAFEPAEGNELKRPPRAPDDPVFNRLMIERVIISAIVVGLVAYFVFRMLLMQGYSVDEARNGTLLLMVLFENIHVFNCRSETTSIFRQNPLSNPILLIGTASAQLIHIGAMYTPWISDVLHIQPVSPQHWLELLGMALTVLVAMELHKLVRHYFTSS